MMNAVLLSTDPILILVKMDKHFKIVWFRPFVMEQQHRLVKFTNKFHGTEVKGAKVKF